MRPAPKRQTAKALAGDQRVALIALACRGPTDVGRGITHWSAAELGIAFAVHPDGGDVSARTVGRVLAEAQLKPNLQRYFLTSHDPHYDEKRRDFVQLYLRPPAGATVLCLDEKPSIQVLGRRYPDLPMKPGYPVYREFEYVRHGVLHLFAAFNVRSGRVLADVQEKKTRFEFIELLDQCAWHYKRGDVHCVLDNAFYHFAPEVKDWLAQHPRFHFHFTPTHASWLNQVECWFSLILRKAIRRGVFDCKGDLHSALMAYVSHWKAKPIPSTGPTAPTSWKLVMLALPDIYRLTSGEDY